MGSRIVEKVGKVEFKVGDVLRLTSEPSRYVLCTGFKGGFFCGVVLHEEENFYGVGHYSDDWIIDSFEKVSVTIEFT